MTSAILRSRVAGRYSNESGRGVFLAFCILLCSLPSVASVRTYWRAPVAEGVMAFEILKSDGAEGRLDILSDGTILIEKSNDRGELVVVPKAFPALPQTNVRIGGESDSTNAVPFESVGQLGVCRGLKFEPSDPRLGDDLRAMKKLSWLVNKPVGKMAYSTVGKMPVRPAIRVAGAASISTWRNWRVTDLTDEKADFLAAHPPRRDMGADPMMPESEYLSRLASESEHVAKIERRDGVPMLVIDGNPAPFALYKSQNGFYGAGAARAGVSILSASIAFGRASGARPASWTKDGFDAKLAVEIVSERMRMAPDSLFVVSMNLTAYPEMSEDYPDEVWRLKDGRRIVGEWTVGGIEDPDGKNPKGWVPWMSSHSKVWRSAVKKVLAAFVEELRQQGYLKRIVGFHLAGYRDGQFAAFRPDYSKAALRAYEEWKESETRPDAPTTYDSFLKRGPFAMQEDLARYLKGLMGKDVIALKWCMGAFQSGAHSTFDITSVCHSDAIDVEIPQPSYSLREPGYALGVKLPAASFAYHGKVLSHEFDFRTWATWDYARGEVRDVGASKAHTVAEWRNLHRKAAGAMLARRAGWWYYDMSTGAWFEPPAIRRDIRETLETARSLLGRKPSPWKPSVAFLIDEDGILSRIMRTNGVDEDPRPSPDGAVAAFAASGVPHDDYVASDWVEHPELAEGYRLVYTFGVDWTAADRKALKARLDVAGVKALDALDTTPRRIHAETVTAGGFVPSRFGLEVDMNGDFASIHCLIPGRYELDFPWGKVTADLATGETRWYGQRGVIVRER